MHETETDLDHTAKGLKGKLEARDVLKKELL